MAVLRLCKKNEPHRTYPEGLQPLKIKMVLCDFFFGLCCEIIRVNKNVMHFLRFYRYTGY